MSFTEAGRIGGRTRSLDTFCPRLRLPGMPPALDTGAMREKGLGLWSVARTTSQPPGSHFQGCRGGDLAALRKRGDNLPRTKPSARFPAIQK